MDETTVSQQMARTCLNAFMDNAAGFTCAEAETLAAFLREQVSDDAADAFLLEHKSGDDDESDLHV